MSNQPGGLLSSRARLIQGLVRPAVAPPIEVRMSEINGGLGGFTVHLQLRYEITFTVNSETSDAVIRLMAKRAMQALAEACDGIAEFEHANR